MLRNITFKQAAIGVIAMAVIQFAIQVSQLSRGLRFISSSLTIDDTYYYLLTAWNTRQLGMVTFDGLHSTNGVQLLWFLIVLGIAYLVNSKTALLFVTLATSFALNGLSYFIIYKIGRLLNRPALILILASLWTLQSLPFRIYSMGMENSLHAFVLWCTIWQCIEFILHLQKNERPNFIGLTVILILNVWSRLDSALLSVILFLFCMGALALTNRADIGTYLKNHRRILVSICLLAGLGFLLQLSLFYWMGGSFLPVSALVKTSGEARGISLESMNKFIEVWLLGLPPIIQGRLPAFALLFITALGVVAVLILRIKFPGHLGELRPLINLWCFLLVGEILYYGYIAVSGVTYYQYFSWYRSPSFIFWILTSAIILLYVFERIKADKYSFIGQFWAPAGFSFLVVSVAIYMFYRSANFTSQLYTARYDTAVWISENFLPGTIFASWNSGQLGFFSNRTFINLDGVINNVDYFQRVMRGPVTVAEYLEENEVDYLVDYSTYGLVPDFPATNAFPINDGTGRSITIWKLTSQAFSAR